MSTTAIMKTTLGLAAILLALATPARAAPGDCLDDWGAASTVVARERLATVESVTRLTRDLLSADVVRTALCRDNDRYVYRMVVRGPRGRLRNLAVDARQPFGR
ncbi:MAG: hypothetical protein ACOYLQ_07235 [Hyphomicrobiaceae bacterium]|jgi:hypothetical protein